MEPVLDPVEELSGVDEVLLKNAQNEEKELGVDTAWTGQEPQSASVAADVMKTVGQECSKGHAVSRPWQPRTCAVRLVKEEWSPFVSLEQCPWYGYLKESGYTSGQRLGESLL